MAKEAFFITSKDKLLFYKNTKNYANLYQHSRLNWISKNNPSFHIKLYRHNRADKTNLEITINKQERIYIFVKKRDRELKNIIKLAFINLWDKEWLMDNNEGKPPF